MPVKITMPAPVDTSREAVLLAQYTPNLGQDIMNVGKIMSAEADKVPSRLQALSTEMDIQERLRQRSEALRAQDFIKNNPELVEGIYKQAYNGQYGNIDFTQLPYWMREAIRKNASAEDKSGSDRRKTEAEIAKFVAQTGLAGLQMANERLTLDSAQDKRADDLATREFLRKSMVDPEIQGLTSAYFSGNEALASIAADRLLQKIPFRDPNKLFTALTALQTARPTNTTGFKEIETDLDTTATGVRTALNADTTDTGLSTAMLLNLLEKGLTPEGLPQHLAEGTTYGKTLQDPTYQTLVKEAYAKWAEKHKDRSPMFSEDLALVAGLGATHNSRLWDWIWPGTGTSIGNGKHLNDTYLFGSEIGELEGQFNKWNEALKKKAPLLKFGHSATGAVALMNQHLKREMGRATTGYNSMRGLPSKEAFLESQRAPLEKIARSFGIDPDLAQVFVNQYLDGLKTGQIPSFNFRKTSN